MTMVNMATATKGEEDGTNLSENSSLTCFSIPSFFLIMLHLVFDNFDFIYGYLVRIHQTFITQNFQFRIEMHGCCVFSFSSDYCFFILFRVTMDFYKQHVFYKRGNTSY